MKLRISGAKKMSIRSSKSTKVTTSFTYFIPAPPIRKTGYREKVITESKDKTKNPSIVIKGKTDDDSKEYNLPVGAH